jgi:hypothetical protein
MPRSACATPAAAAGNTPRRSPRERRPRTTFWPCESICSVSK